LERSWVLVVLCHEAIDGIFEFVDGVKHTAGETPLRELGEETLDGVEPGGGCPCEVEGRLPIPTKPPRDSEIFSPRVRSLAG
jgi:hypothetical protein